MSFALPYRERSGGRRTRPWALGETLGVEGDNFLVLKVTYWLGL